MKTTLQLITFLFLLPFYTLQAQVQIGAFEANQLGTDNSTQEIQIIGPPNTSFTGVLLNIENDPTPNPGIVQEVSNISGSFDANGILVATIDDLENPSFTLVLLDSFTGTVNSTDIDTNDDGTPDNTTTFGTILDAIGVSDTASDQQVLYGAALGGVDLENIASGDEPSLVFRDPETGTIYQVNQDGDAVFNAITDVEVAASDFSPNPLPVTSFDFSVPAPINTNDTTLGTTTNEFSTNSLVIYPNPIKSEATFTNTRNLLIQSVTIYNTQGAMILSDAINTTQNEFKIDYSSVSSGVYFMTITSNTGTVTKKVIKN